MQYSVFHSLFRRSSYIGIYGSCNMCSIVDSIVTSPRINILIDCNKLWQNIPSNNVLREMQVLKKLNENTDTRTFNNIAMTCDVLLPKMSYNLILQVLSVMYIKQPAKVKTVRFYKNAMKILKVGLVQYQLTANQILACIFFIALQKRKFNDFLSLLLQYLPDCKTLSVSELSVLAEAVFRCSTKMPTNYYHFIEGLIETESENLVNSQVQIVSLCKVLRCTAVSEDLDLTNLTTALQHKQIKYEFSTIAHILQFYAATRSHYPVAIACLTEEADAHITAFLKNECSQHSKRFMHTPKYLDNFIWAISTLNYELESNFIVNQIAYFFKIFNLYQQDPSKLANTLLCYWMLDIKLERVVSICFAEGTFLKVMNNINWKEISRLHLLLTCVEVEAPNITIPKQLKEQISTKKVALHIRETVQQAFDAISGLSNKFNLEEITIDCPIEALYIAGVSFKHPAIGYIHVDVLDELTTVKHINILNGLARLKLRLLKAKEYKSILIPKGTLSTTKVTTEYIIKAIKELLR